MHSCFLRFYNPDAAKSRREFRAAATRRNLGFRVKTCEGFRPLRVIARKSVPMHPKSLISTTLLLLGLALAAPGFAQDSQAHDKAPPAKAKADDKYPLKTCVVSDEALGDAGDYISYVHQEPGKPDREIRFCCEGCIDDFKKEPAKYLKKLDDAAAKKAAAAPAKNAHKH
jgi:hypothetical protein